MSFRVTQQYAASTARDHISRQTAELFQVQQQISSGLRIQRPSDDPAGTRRSLIQKDRLDRLNSQISSLQHVESRLNSAEVQLREAGNLLLRARDIAMSARQITDESERTILGRELDGILEQLVSVANAQDESGYLFSGTASDVEPFPDAGRSKGNSVYHGTDDRTQLYIAGDASRQALLPGSDVFQGRQRGETVIIGKTGVQPGQGVPTAVGHKLVTVKHTATSYAAGSGVAPGVSSGDRDTVIGPSGMHQLRIVDTSGTGSAGTVSLNGGPPVAFTSSDTDLVVTDVAGRRVYVNTTAITPGFSGAVDLTADGTVSLDGGATNTAIDFSANQLIQDSSDGGTVFLDTTDINRPGEDRIEFGGTSDVFAVVRQLRDDILNTNGLSANEQSDALGRRLGELERVHGHILDVLGVQSVGLEQLDRLQTRTEDLALSEQVELSDTTSADITQAVLRLQEIQNLQQFTMAAVSRVLTPSLLNFLQ